MAQDDHKLKFQNWFQIRRHKVVHVLASLLAHVSYKLILLSDMYLDFISIFCCLNHSGRYLYEGARWV